MDDYLVAHPNAMPAREAAMTYLFEDPRPVLRVVAAHDQPADGPGRDETTYDDVRKSA